VIVAIAGAHGNIAMRLTGLLVSEGHTVIGLIRNPDHASDVSRQGASPVVCDLEQVTVDEVAEAVKGADAAIFAAGAGPGSGAARKLTMDRDGALKLLDACTAADARRFQIVSSVGAEHPSAGDDAFSVYLQAKAQADEAVQASDRDWTIVRPGRLTDDRGTERLRIQSAPFRGSVSRDDVAAVLAYLLRDPRFSRRVLYVNDGEQTIEQALEAVLSG
jgi:nucleoside-diphosphate-sugar epimerase